MYTTTVPQHVILCQFKVGEAARSPAAITVLFEMKLNWKRRRTYHINTCGLVGIETPQDLLATVLQAAKST